MTVENGRMKALKRVTKEVSFVLLKAVMPFGTGDDIVGIVRNLNTSQKDLNRQVEEAVGALTKSTQLITELEGSLGERAKELAKLQIEYKRVSELASLTEEQSKAVTEQLEQTMGKNRRKQLLVAFILNLTAGLVIFILGVFTSDWIKSFPDILQKETEQSVVELIEEVIPAEEPGDINVSQGADVDKKPSETEVAKSPQEQ